MSIIMLAYTVLIRMPSSPIPRSHILGIASSEQKCSNVIVVQRSEGQKRWIFSVWPHVASANRTIAKIETIIISFSAELDRFVYRIL